MEMGSKQPQDKAVSGQQRSGGGGQRGTQGRKEKQNGQHQCTRCPTPHSSVPEAPLGAAGGHARSHPFRDACRPDLWEKHLRDTVPAPPTCPPPTLPALPPSFPACILRPGGAPLALQLRAWAFCLGDQG